MTAGADPPAGPPGGTRAADTGARADHPSSVAAAIAGRRDRARSAVAAMDAREGAFARRRFLAFAAAAAILLAGPAVGLPRWTAAFPAGLFLVFVAGHRRLRRDRAREERRAAVHQAALARLDGRWRGAGDDGARFLEAEHAYAGHLDVLGPGSLFQYVDRARTSAGKETLARWLLGDAAPAEIARRQAAVAELRDRDALREDLALLGDDAAAHARLARLAAWAAAPRALRGAGLRAGAIALPAANAVALASWGALDAPVILPVAALVATWAFLRRVGPAVEAVLHGADAGLEDLRLLEDVLGRWEREEFAAPFLAEARAALGSGADGATRRIAALRRVLELRDAAANQVFAPFALALAWPVWMAILVEAWRLRSGAAAGGWLDALGRLEAAASLAGHAAEHPADPFPEIVDGPPVYDGTGLGHPLLREAECVRNDLRLDATRRVLVVSGSNMSGKSTFLRTVGTNAVLALAGAPVRATRLRLTPFVVGASIGVHDSLLDGRSRFYAEAERVALVVRLARRGGAPLLFLLDELFHGTNSGDRREGAAAVVRALLAAGAYGLVTTHDLELARIAEDMDGSVANAHFEDRVEDGRMTFDYRIRPGVVQRGNAIALLRAVGLDV